jgi:peptidyl-prolyl cis-trans isomerase D
MITTMRKYRKALQVGLLVVIAAFVASLFIFGTGKFGGPDGQAPDAVASVNGESIPVERYQRRYQAYLEAYAQVYRDRFTPELAEQMGLPQQVMNDLVQEAVVVQRARAEGLELNDEELNAQIQAVPAFQENGRFSLKRYQDFLRRRGLTEVGFEQDVRRELTRMKVMNTVKEGVKVSDAELEQAYVARREEVRAAWALVEIAPLVAAATAGDDELEAYLKAHPNEFRQPERRKIQYVTLTAKDFTRPVPDADVEKYYSEHAAEFETPRQVRASHVLVRVPETGGSESEDKAKAKVADVIRRAKAGEDFARLARETSEDPGSKDSGGDLGLVRKGEMVSEFEQAVFALKKGEVSAEPLRTPYGYHAIKVTDIREGGRKPLREVAPQIRERLAAEAADKAARAKADEVRPPLQAGGDFMEAAKKLGLQPVETTMARLGARVGLGRPDPMEESAFGVALGGVSAPVKTPAGYVVLKAIETIPAGVPPLAEIKGKVTASVKRQKAEAVAQERARTLVAEARNGDLAAAAKKVGATAGETPRFSRTKPAERLPGDAMLAALQTTPGALTEPVKTPQGYYVLKVLERVPPDASGLAAEREKLQRELLSQKQNQAWEAWIAGARASAKIETYGRQARRS